jgi:hypothetical protein
VIEQIDGRDSFGIFYTRQAGRRSKGPRVYYRVNGGFGPDWEIPNNDMDTVHHALIERVYCVKLDGKYQRAPKPWDTPEVLEAAARVTHKSDAARLAWCRAEGIKIVNRNLSRFEQSIEEIAKGEDKPPTLTQKEFTDMYVGVKRKRYEAAAQSLLDAPLNMKKDSTVKIFTKDEYSKGTPRAIQPRSPRFNVELGRHIKHREHSIFQAIDAVFDPAGEHVTVQKGRNSIERGNAIHNAWTQFANPVCVMLDAARFDQHLNVALLKFANRITRSFCSDDSPDITPLQELLDAQLYNSGRFQNWEGIIKYKTDGCGMSGDMNTSLRNVLIMCGSMFEYLLECCIGNYRYGNDGDDGWLIMEEKDLKRFTDNLHTWFRKIGLTMKIEGIAYNLEDIDFCQGRPVFSEENGYVLMANPCKRLYSDLVTTKNISSKKVYHKWMGAVAGCGLAQTKGTPILSRHYKWLAKGATPYIPMDGDMYYRHSWWNAEGMRIVTAGETRDPTWRERISFYFAFDITPRVQMQMEKYYDELPPPCWTTPATLKNVVPNIHKIACPPVQACRLLN